MQSIDALHLPLSVSFLEYAVLEGVPSNARSRNRHNPGYSAGEELVRLLERPRQNRLSILVLVQPVNVDTLIGWVVLAFSVYASWLFSWDGLVCRGWLLCLKMTTKTPVSLESPSLIPRRVTSFFPYQRFFLVNPLHRPWFLPPP